MSPSSVDQDGQAGSGGRSIGLRETEVAISAVQCWTSIEENLALVLCTIMSTTQPWSAFERLRSGYLRGARHHALRLASGTPSALLHRNNNYGSDPNKAVCFHCSNLPKHFFRSVKMDFQEIIAGTVGKENTFGTCVGLISRENSLPVSRPMPRPHARLRRGRPVYRRSVEHFWGRGSGGDSAPANCCV